MPLATYSDYQAQVSSEKIALVIVEASRRYVGWELYSGSVYRVAFEYQSIVSVEDSGTALAAGSSTSLSAGQYYLDRSAGYLYARTSDSVNPSTKFIGVTFRLFFANAHVTAPHDLASGYEVEWAPYYLAAGRGFKSWLDNQNLIGFAIEGEGTVAFQNDQSFWSPIFDKLYFENQLVKVYSWNRGLPITQAKIMFRGRIQKKTYSGSQVSFTCKDQLNELRAPIPLTNLEDYSGALIPPSMLNAKQRLLYGYVKGHVPSNVSQQLELTGYTITGTVTLTQGDKNVTGSGTSFLAQVTEGDELLFGSDTTWYTVEAVSSDTGLTLTEAYAGTGNSGFAIRLKGSHPKRYMNRTHLVAGHALREPSTTVAAVVSLTCVQVADVTDFIAGENVLIGGEVLVIERVSGSRVTFTTQMAATPSVGASIKVLSLKNVYLGSRLLTYSRDYTYSASTAVLTLDQLAEFNVAPVRQITGTLAFTAASRTVTGTSTTFKSQVAPGDWVRRQGQSTWCEVLRVDSDTQLILRSVPGYTSSGASDLKKPEVYEEGETVLTVDALGVTENGLSSGTFIKTAAKVVQDIIERVGLEDQLNTSSFDTAAQDAEHKVGLVIPAKVTETKTKAARDIINEINLSVFGSLFQNEDYQLEYSILSPARAPGILALAESDIIAPALSADGSRIVKTVRVRYLRKEHDAASAADSVAEVTKESESGAYLARTEKEHLVETVLIESEEAQILANRWSFLLEQASAVFRFRTGLQGARLSVNDKVDITHEKLYERVGVSATRKIAAVQSVEKDISGVTVELSDLSNAFSRCMVIADDDAPDWVSAEDADKLYNGYISDDHGLQASDPETFGTNLIW